MIRVQFKLYCDHCHEEYEPDRYYILDDDLINDAASDGWQSEDNNDYCPECWAELHPTD